MLKNLAFTMLTAVYYSVIPVYCFMQLFSCTDKFKIYIHVLASFFILWALQFIKLYEHASEATTLSQLFIFLNVFFLFRGPVKQKLLSYFIFLLTAILTEILSINIYIQIYNHFFHQPAYTATNIYSLCSFHEKLMIQMMIFSFGYLFYKNIFSLLKKCINYLKFSLLLLITLPIIHPLITTEFTQYYKFQQSFIPVLLYIICCCITFPLFIHGLHLFKKEQIAFNRNLHKMELLKQQMEVSEEMKQEYVKIRKWNHDIENHLLSLEYLTRTRKADEAERYCSSVLLNSPRSSPLPAHPSIRRILYYEKKNNFHYFFNPFSDILSSVTLYRTIPESFFLTDMSGRTCRLLQSVPAPDADFYRSENRSGT